MKTKNEYQKPLMVVETFVANEYCAPCGKFNSANGFVQLDPPFAVDLDKDGKYVSGSTGTEGFTTTGLPSGYTKKYGQVYIGNYHKYVEVDYYKSYPSSSGNYGTPTLSSITFYIYRKNSSSLEYYYSVSDSNKTQS